MGAVAMGFSRLKGIFRSGINFRTYDSILETAGRKTVGNLPEDLLGLVLQGSKSKGDSIKNIQSAFEETAAALGKINEFESQAINRLQVNKSTIERIRHFITKNHDIRFWRIDPLFAEKELESIIKAEEVLLKRIKQEIPQAKNVVITSLGSGNFGNAYKCEIFGENAQKLISDKVLKIYKDKPQQRKISEKSFNFINSKSFENLLKQQLQKEKDPDNLKEMQRILDKLPAFRRLMGYRLKVEEALLKSTESVHGIAAEANISEYLRYYSGHKLNPSDGLALPYLFGLGDAKFAVSEFIGKDSKALRDFSFERLGLSHFDFKCNPNNGINGICIDFGGIISAENAKELVGNKQGIKALKSVFGNSASISSNPVKLQEILSQYNISNDAKKQIETIFNSIQN